MNKIEKQILKNQIILLKKATPFDKLSAIAIFDTDELLNPKESSTEQKISACLEGGKNNE